VSSEALALAHGLVKICGLRRPEHAVAAVEAGADMLGFVFAPSKRRVTPEEAASCVRAARVAAQGPVLAVGVFVDATVDELKDAVETASLDVIQLHGSGPNRWSGPPRPSIRGLRPMPGAGPSDVLGMMAADRAAGCEPLAWLIDGYDPSAHGGTGVRADWNLAALIAGRRPLFLAGGLTPENVGEAIRTVRPLGVDVSSGVETDGTKDVEKIRAFVSAARSAFDSMCLDDR
jgi:phosphoribosylanthranilate isomerase